MNAPQPSSDSGPLSPGSSLHAALVSAVGSAHVLTDPAVTGEFTQDWTRRFSGPCRAVVRPGSTGEVAAVVRACVAAGVPVLPQGGNTGLVGGSVPAGSPGRHGAPVIVSTRRLSAISAVDPLSGQLTAGAGATLGDVHRAAEAAGWIYGVDLAARDSCTIGGTVATNAGGINVIAYGMTRASVVGIEAVLPDGQVISHLSGLLKDNTGYDLGALFCGSEGTLGIITAVRVRLHRPHAATSVALVGCSGFASALELMSRARAGGFPVIGAEVIDATGMELVMGLADLPYPLESRWELVVLLEIADGGDGSGLPLDESADAVVALDATSRARLWSYRERQSEAYATLGVVHKLDISVPLELLAACADELRALAESFPNITTYGVFGHLADGNIHLEIVGPAWDDLEIDHALLACAARYGGSISAEHGVGRAKARELGMCRSSVEIAAMKAIKDAWDPQGLMHPGVLFAE